MKKIPVILLLAFFAMPAIYGQIKIGDNPQAISPTSVLELESNDRVLVITRINTQQMDAIVPNQGAMVYNTDTQCIHYYDGTQWINLCAAAFEIPLNSISTEHIVNGGVNGIDIQNGSIGPGKLQNQSVTQDKLSENSVGAFALDNDNINLSDFTNDLNLLTISGAAGNDIVDNGGAFYDNQPLLDDIAANTAFINGHITADADTNINNEIQTLSFNAGANQLTLTNPNGNNVITLPGGGNPTDELITNAVLTGTNLVITEAGTDWTVPLGSLGGGGTTEVADLTTILGVGTGADPFRIAPGTDGQFLATNAAGNPVWQTVALGGSTEEADQTTITGIGTNADPFKIEPGGNGQFLTTDAAGNIAWQTAAPGGSTEEADQNTITGIGTNADPFKIEPSTTNGQFLSTDATGAVAWADVTGSTEEADQTTITGIGTNADPFKIEPSATNGQFLSTDATGAVAWAAAPGEHSGPGMSLFFADATTGLPTTAFNPNGGGTALTKPSLIWDQTQRVNSGALGIGLDGAAINGNVKVHIMEAVGGISYSLEVQNRTASAGSGVGILFASDTFNDGKGALVFERQGSYGIGDFHFTLNQKNTAPPEAPTLADAAFTVRNNKDIVLYGGIDINGIGTGSNGQVLTSTGAGVQWGAGGGGTDNQQLTLATNLLTLEDGGTPVDLSPYLDNQTAAEVVVTATPTNYTAATADVEAHLAGINTALASGGLSGTTGSIFFADALGAPTENNGQFFWDATNNRLGIGTNAPDAKLRVNGQIRTSTIRTTDGSAANPPYQFENDANSGMFLPTTNELGLSANGAEAIRINASQNVGIGGITAPDESLHIGNNMRLNGSFEDKDGESGTSGQILSSTGGGTDWINAPTGGADGVVSNISTSGTDLVITGASGGFNGNVDLNPVFATDAELATAISDSEALDLDKDETNEIQTMSASDDTMEVVGLLDNYTFRVKEITNTQISSNPLDAIDGTKINPDFGNQDVLTTGDFIDNGITIVAPDFVFQKYFNGFSSLNDEYEFKSLDEIESFVKQHNHLPGIKSAYEIINSGEYRLTESSLGHLEKIEELFLHTIEQENKIKSLQSENKTLTDELETIKKDLEEIKVMLKKSN